MILPPYIPIGCSPVWLEDHKQLMLSAVCGHAAVNGHGSHLTIGRLRWSRGGGTVWSLHLRHGGWRLLLVQFPPTKCLEVNLGLVSSDEVLGG